MATGFLTQSGLGGPLVNDMLGGGMLAGATEFLGAFMLVMVLALIAAYIYSSLTLMRVAKRTKTEPAWLAWVPIGNLYLMSKMAKMHWWPLLLLIVGCIPYIGVIASLVFAVYSMIWMWKICEARERPGWWALLTLIPFAGWIWGLVMWGILAWGEE